MRLDQTQLSFQRYLLGDLTQAPPVNEPPERLDIYRRGYAARLVEALGNDFPGLKAMLGSAAFADSMRRYIAGHPSSHPSLRWLGRHLADHLARQGEASAAGMARFDWAVALAFDAPDEPLVALPDLLALPAEAWAHFGLRFAAAVSMLTAEAGTGDLRQALLHADTAGGAMPGVAMNDTAPGLPVNWLIWRSGEDVQYRALPADEADGFASMQAGASFAAMCEILAGDHHAADPAQRGAEMLQDWLQRGLVSAILLPA